jgi:2-polyprenyl-3-methyl-5-hydroxy-6-metoxy-1,4-benzoquinol methylase
MISQEKIENLSEWYVKNQLNFDRILISYRYKTIREYFKKGIGLEMGSGDGVMTAMLKNDFEELDIVEGSAQLLETIPNFENVRKYCSFFENFEPTRKYNTIVMEHILEHIEKPVEVLAKTKSWLNAEGVVIIGVPNAKSYHRLAAVKMGMLKSEYELNERDKALGHYRVYDSETLRSDVEKSGYKVAHIGGVFFKPISNKQIEENWTPQMIEGFFQLGKDFQENAAELFIIATLN